MLQSSKFLLLLSRMKMRQNIAFGLSIFYLLSVIGIALSLHFCSGDLSSLRLATKAKCSMCKADEKAQKEDHCCKNTAVDAKITDSHQSGSSVTLPTDFGFTLFLAPIISQYLEALLPRFLSKVENKAPPLSARQALYAFNCVFRN
jgi:hypothetical protein